MTHKKYKCKITVKKKIQKKVELSQTSLTLNYGSSKQITLLNAPGKIAWFSNNKSVAYSYNGLIEGKSIGDAVITAKYYGQSYSCKVHVVSGESTNITENGVYTSKNKVAKYIHTYNHLPKNFITKEEANNLGWYGGALLNVAPFKCIGGDRYSNYEKTLPSAYSRIYYECDIDTLGALSRGAKRIIYSNDGLIYYTDDHYASFTNLYDNEY